MALRQSITIEGGLGLSTWRVQQSQGLGTERLRDAHVLARGCAQRSRCLAALRRSVSWPLLPLRISHRCIVAAARAPEAWIVLVRNLIWLSRHEKMAHGAATRLWAADQQCGSQEHARPQGQVRCFQETGPGGRPHPRFPCTQGQ